MQITFEDYQKVIEKIRPSLDVVTKSLAALPDDTPVDEIIASLCYTVSLILNELEDNSDTFSIDSWYTTAVQSILGKMTEEVKEEEEVPSNKIRIE